MSQISAPDIAAEATVPAESEVTVAGTIERPLTTADRCDACGAQAFVRAVLTSGQLLLCGHHARAHMPALKRQALYIQDETATLSPAQ
ncbi:MULTISPECIES: DUF7455 domain-containing protein [Actinomyces]|uniref:DUF7455 domain-containing protein n=1 Tax=Actinomyces respiraculi TaxID=2744574 RepID=A0A7T0PVL3_9ACTO|nr:MULTISPECIES: hypothetical protein [Actinomyces]QPL04538.1 hypothetical protein ID810_06910 [Actinomyces respiraculi]